MNAVVEKMPVAQVPEAVTPMTMIDRALASGATPETLEKLLTLQERWEANQAKRAFDEAIAKAKTEIPAIIKNKTVDFTTTKGTTNYKYETLPAVLAVVDPILNKHGLNHRYSSKVEAGQIFVTCIISHVAGHREETTLSSAPDTTGNKNSVQAIGSATTYLQRYTLKLALGISAADDTDGVPPANHMLIDAEQFREMQALIEESNSEVPKLLAYVKADELEKLNVSQWKMACEAMRRIIAKRKAEAGNAK